MDWNNQLIDVAKFCFENKITLMILNQADVNSAHYEKDGNKTNFIISICNEKDKKLKKIINDGFNNLKNFIEQVGGE